MGRVQTFTADQVSRAIQGNRGLLLIHIGSSLASSCEVVRAELESLAPQFSGRVRFAELELPLQELELIQRFCIESLPTLILFKDRREVERLERLMLKEQLEEFLELSVSFYGPSLIERPRDGNPAVDQETPGDSENPGNGEQGDL